MFKFIKKILDHEIKTYFLNSWLSYSFPPFLRILKRIQLPILRNLKPSNWLEDKINVLTTLAIYNSNIFFHLLIQKLHLNSNISYKCGDKHKWNNIHFLQTKRYFSNLLTGNAVYIFTIGVVRGSSINDVAQFLSIPIVKPF